MQLRRYESSVYVELWNDRSLKVYSNINIRKRQLAADMTGDSQPSRQI